MYFDDKTWNNEYIIKEKSEPGVSSEASTCEKHKLEHRDFICFS